MIRWNGWMEGIVGNGNQIIPSLSFQSNVESINRIRETISEYGKINVIHLFSFSSFHISQPATAAIVPPANAPIAIPFRMRPLLLLQILELPRSAQISSVQPEDLAAGGPRLLLAGQ